MWLVSVAVVAATVCAAAGDARLVTCGSVVKLASGGQAGARLHSHDVKYGSGSGQQSVTAAPANDDVNSYWTLLGAHDAGCRRGAAVACGARVRLAHQTSGCLLHSHHFSSPLSSNQEVSCFGTDGQGDTGDNWLAECDDDFWTRDSSVRLKHVDTGAYLATSGHRYGRPISGQLEVCGVTSARTAGTEWLTTEGVFMFPSSQEL